ncbi:hypothetical protein FRC10_006269 [Ceratobasidium sp. 414]|nr:hypothetical protein FRC10_006269 [Ceratobasidium sp. 414]
MPDQHLTVFGHILVGEVTSVTGRERHQKRIATCKVRLQDDLEHLLIVDVHYWGDCPKDPMLVVLVVGETYIPANGEPIIFADLFAITGTYTESNKFSTLPLYILVVGIAKETEGSNTVLETEIYHREFDKVPLLAIGSIYLACSALADFDKEGKKGVPIINVYRVAFFLFKPAKGAAKLANAPGKGKRKLERTESHTSVSSATLSPRKPKVEPPFSAPKSGSDDK